MSTIVAFVLMCNQVLAKYRNLDYLPTAGMTDTQISEGGVVLYIIGILYIFLALRTLITKHLNPCLFRIKKHLKLKTDSSSSVLFSVGRSIPELFIVIFSTFLTNNIIGESTVYGAASIKGMVLLGICSIVNSKNIELQWWLIVRDSLFSLIALSLIIIFNWDLSITWWEGFILVVYFFIYTVFLFKNKSIEKYSKKVLRVPYDGDDIDYNQLPTKEFPIRRYSITELKDYTPPKLNFQKGVLAKMIRNSQMQVEKSHSEKLMELKKKLKNVIYIILQSIEVKKRCAKQNRLERKVVEKHQNYSQNNEQDEGIVSRIRKLETLQSGDRENEINNVEVVVKGSRFKHYLLRPLAFMWKYSIGCFESGSLWMVSLALSIAWIGFFCYLIVWWMSDVARSCNIPYSITGLIFIAYGIHGPEVFETAVKIRLNENDEEIEDGEGEKKKNKKELNKKKEDKKEKILSNCLRGNVISFSWELGIVWTFYGISGNDLSVSVGMYKTSLALISALALSYMFIGGFKWRLNKSLGVVLLFYYVLFLLFYLLFEFGQL